MKRSIFQSLFHPKKDPEDELIDFLKTVPLFTGLFNKDFKKIIEIIHPRVYEPEEIIFKQGDRGVGLYIIRSGSVSIYEEFPSRKRIKLADLKEGDFFGELALFADAPRSASAVAKSDSQILGFFQSDLLELIDSNPSLGVKVVLSLARILALRMLKSIENKEEEK